MKDLEHFKNMGQILSKTQQKKILGGSKSAFPCSDAGGELWTCCNDYGCTSCECIGSGAGVSCDGGWAERCYCV